MVAILVRRWQQKGSQVCNAKTCITDRADVPNQGRLQMTGHPEQMVLIIRLVKFPVPGHLSQNDIYQAASLGKIVPR